MKEDQYRIMKSCFDMLGMTIDGDVISSMPDVILYQFNAMSYGIYCTIFNEIKCRIAKEAFRPLENEKQVQLLMKTRFANIGLELIR